MRLNPRCLRPALLAGLSLTAFLGPRPAAAQRAAVQPAPPGEVFSAGTYKVFNPQNEVSSLDLSTLLGKKPVVLFYWIPGNKRAEEVFRSLLEVTRGIGSEKLAVLGVAVPNPGIGVTPDVIRQRIESVGVDVPVLSDEEFTLGKKLQVKSVPNISIIDASGRLRLANGASLQQALEYKVDLTAAIRRVADTGKLHTYGYLPRYYPVNELVGQPAPDFTAPLIEDGAEQSWNSLIDDQKINVLIFWSVECPHCRKQLPEINAWLEENPGDLNVFGCVTVNDEAGTSKTREFCEENGFVFPNLVDLQAEVGQLYGVTTTPTIVVIGPDGVVDSAITSSLVDFGKMMERKKRELLATPRSPS